MNVDFLHSSLYVKFKLAVLFCSSSGTASYRKQRQKSPKSSRKRQKITSSFMEDVSYGEDEQQQQRPAPPAAVGEDKKPSTSGKVGLCNSVGGRSVKSSTLCNSWTLFTRKTRRNSSPMH